MFNDRSTPSNLGKRNSREQSRSNSGTTTPIPSQIPQSNVHSAESEQSQQLQQKLQQYQQRVQQTQEQLQAQGNSSTSLKIKKIHTCKYVYDYIVTYIHPISISSFFLPCLAHSQLQLFSDEQQDELDRVRMMNKLSLPQQRLKAVVESLGPSPTM